MQRRSYRMIYTSTYWWDSLYKCFSYISASWAGLGLAALTMCSLWPASCDLTSLPRSQHTPASASHLVTSSERLLCCWVWTQSLVTCNNVMTSLTCLLVLTLTLPWLLASALTPAQSEAEQPSSWVRSASPVVTPVISWPRQQSRKLPLEMITLLTRSDQGIARTQSPTNKNYAFELPTFGVIVGVSRTEVQWSGLALEEPPSWSRLTSTPGKYA